MKTIQATAMELFIVKIRLLWCGENNETLCWPNID